MGTPPTAFTATAEGAGAAGFTVRGTVNPKGKSTTYVVDYGTTSSYGSTTATQDAGAGSSDVAVQVQVTGLSASTTYHYRLRAVSADGTGTGGDGTYTTTATVATASMAISGAQVVATASTNDRGNSWGGHMNRIVVTKDGYIFGAWNIDGVDPVVQWRLGWRRSGTWTLVASGPNTTGVEPPELLAMPDGTLMLIMWDNGQPKLWQITPNDGAGTVSVGTVEASGISVGTSDTTGWHSGHPSYGNSGVAIDGTIYCVQSVGGGPGSGGTVNTVRVGRRSPAGVWTHNVKNVGSAASHAFGRMAYCCPIADRSGSGLTLVATRDHEWLDLGYNTPTGSPDNAIYGFNAMWWLRCDDTVGAFSTWTIVKVAEEAQVGTGEPKTHGEQCGHLVDSTGRTHILYMRSSSDGTTSEVHHAVVSSTGTVLTNTVAISSNGVVYHRIMENDAGTLFLVSINVTNSPANQLDVRKITMTGDTPSYGAVTTVALGQSIGYSGHWPMASWAGIPRSAKPWIMWPDGASFDDGIVHAGQLQLPTP